MDSDFHLVLRVTPLPHVPPEVVQKYLDELFDALNEYSKFVYGVELTSEVFRTIVNALAVNPSSSTPPEGT